MRKGLIPLRVPGWRGVALDKSLSIVMIIAILSALGMLAYIISVPKIEEFTEFYLLGLEGKATGYPTTMAVEDEVKVVVGIVNYEGEEVSYRLEVKVDGKKKGTIEPIVLDNEQKWEETVGFTVDRAGLNQKVEFLLYKQQENEIYQSLYLWVDVE